jgi:hypothetical protein
MTNQQAFTRPKFAPNGAKTIPMPADSAGAILGMAIQLGDGGGSGPSKLGSLVRGTMPRPQTQPVQLTTPAAPAPPPKPALGQQQPQGQGVVVEIVGVTQEGEELVDTVELTFPAGTDVQSCRQVRR